MGRFKMETAKSMKGMTLALLLLVVAFAGCLGEDKDGADGLDSESDLDPDLDPAFSGCYNSVTHASDANMSQVECEAYGYYVNYGATVTNLCYNTVNHWSDANLSQTECVAYEYVENYTLSDGQDICYNMVAHIPSGDTKAACEAYSYIE